MDQPTQRKLNLLVHLAKVDGKFHKSEKKLIEEFVNEKGLEINDFHMITSDKIDEFDHFEDKIEMLFLALKLIQADQIIDKKELAYCKELALKLGFKPAIIDAYADKEFDRNEFDQDVKNWLI